MIAVIVDARKPGSSSWVNVRSCTRIQVSGLHGGIAILSVVDMEEERTNMKVKRDGKFPIDPSVEKVMARIVSVSEKSRINIDLVT